MVAPQPDTSMITAATAVLLRPPTPSAPVDLMAHRLHARPSYATAMPSAAAPIPAAQEMVTYETLSAN